MNDSFVEYDGGSIFGVLGTETISIGDDDRLTAINQTFVVVSQEHGFENMTADGMAGFAFSGLNNGAATFVDMLYLEKKIEFRMFSLYFNDNQYNNRIHPDPQSCLIIGGFSTDYVADKETTVVTLRADPSRGYWELPLQSVIMGIETININSTTAIFDSTIGYISAPTEDAIAIRQYFFINFEQCHEKNNGFIVCDCEDLRDYPNFIIKLGNPGRNFTLPPSAYFLRENLQCLLLVNIDDTLTNTWRLGGPFLRKWYTIYDMDSSNIMLYPAKVSVDHSNDFDESAKWIIVFFVVLLIVISIVMSVFLYLFCCRHKLNFEETYKPLFTAKYTLPPHYHRTAVRSASSGEVVPDVMPTSRQNRVFPGISNKK